MTLEKRKHDIPPLRPLVNVFSVRRLRSQPMDTTIDIGSSIDMDSSLGRDESIAILLEEAQAAARTWEADIDKMASDFEATLRCNDVASSTSTPTVMSPRMPPLKCVPGFVDSRVCSPRKIQRLVGPGCLVCKLRRHRSLCRSMARFEITPAESSVCENAPAPPAPSPDRRIGSQVVQGQAQADLEPAECRKKSKQDREQAHSPSRRRGQSSSKRAATRSAAPHTKSGENHKKDPNSSAKRKVKHPRGPPSQSTQCQRLCRQGKHLGLVANLLQRRQMTRARGFDGRQSGVVQLRM